MDDLPVEPGTDGSGPSLQSVRGFPGVRIPGSDFLRQFLTDLSGHSRWCLCVCPGRRSLGDGGPRGGTPDRPLKTVSGRSRSGPVLGAPGPVEWEGQDVIVDVDTGVSDGRVGGRTRTSVRPCLGPVEETVQGLVPVRVHTDGTG